MNEVELTFYNDEDGIWIASESSNHLYRVLSLIFINSVDTMVNKMRKDIKMHYREHSDNVG